MKTIKYILTLMLMVAIQFVVTAQPLPPSSPNGNPVPVTGLIFILIIGFAGIGVVNLKRTKE